MYQLRRRVNNEIVMLMRLAEIIRLDPELPVALDVTHDPDRNMLRLQLDIVGLALLGNDPKPVPRFTVSVRLPSDYPLSAPEFKFDHPVPFHPHVWRDGRICWGTALNRPRPDLMLVDWVRGVFDYLQFSQDPASLLLIDPSSPANVQALHWYNSNRASLLKYVPPIDMARFRALVEQARR